MPHLRRVRDALVRNDVFYVVAADPELWSNECRHEGTVPFVAYCTFTRVRNLSAHLFLGTSVEYLYSCCSASSILSPWLRL